MKKGVYLIFITFTIIFLINFISCQTGNAVKVPECSDHFDNDGDGYCDAATKDGYCSDGSKLGDINCKNLQDSETGPKKTEELCNGKSTDVRQCGYNIGECSYGIEKRKCYDGDLGEWSICQGAVDPQPEICDGLDNNCNGIIDDFCITITGAGSKASAKVTGVSGKPSGGGGGSTKATCTDSDGGAQYNIYGYVSGKFSNGTTFNFYDSCNGNILKEFYCVSAKGGAKTPYSTTSNCQYGCTNGTCLGAPTCSDGTLYNVCSTNKPLYCSNGNLVNNCNTCGCPSAQYCGLDGTCNTIPVTTNISINGTSGNDVFQIYKNSVWLNGVNVYTLTSELVTLNGLEGDDTFVTVGSGTQIINGGAGVDSYWVDSTDIVNDVSAEETSAGSLHKISKYYQPWNSSILSPDYVDLDSNGEAIKDPTGNTYCNYNSTALFSSAGVHYYDITQGGLGDCYYMAAMGTGALEMPQVIKQGLVKIGDGNYIIRNYKSGQAIYLKLDADLPCGPAYAKITNGLWVALLEKAFAHLRYGSNTYASIAGGWMHEGYSTVFNKAGYLMYYPSSYTDSSLYLTYTDALNNNQLNTEATPSVINTGICTVSGIVGNHAYMSINSSTDGINYYLYTHNPWYGNTALIKLNGTQFKSCYDTLEISAISV